MQRLVDRALTDLVDEPGLEPWLDEVDAVVDLVRWQAFQNALGLGMPDLACEILQTDGRELLRSVGRRWGSFGPVECHSDDLRTCLAEILGPSDRTLYEVGADGAFIVHAFGACSAFAPVAAGVVEGLADRIGEPVEVSETPTADRVRYHVSPAVPDPPSGGSTPTDE